MANSKREDGKVALWVRPEIQKYLDKEKVIDQEPYDSVLYRVLGLNKNKEVEEIF